jgi:opacity protein-like surface antigen
MKKTIFALLVLISLAKVADAQKGSILLYGNIGFTSSRDSSTATFSTYDFNPGIGYQLSDRWTAGLNFAIDGSRQEVTEATVPTGNYNTTSTFNIGPFLRYAYAISSMFSIYGQAEINYLSGKQTPFELVETSYTGFGANLFPAIGMNIKNGFALNFSFGGLTYQEITFKGAANSSSQFAITLGQGFNFGVSKNFGANKK